MREGGRQRGEGGREREGVRQWEGNAGRGGGERKR